jgi:hypothetical protein
MGVSEATFYIWKKKYAHLSSVASGRGRPAEAPGDQSLDKHILIKALRKRADAHKRRERLVGRGAVRCWIRLEGALARA